jgi:hypothetical protein
MATESTSMSLDELLRKSSRMSDNIRLNAAKIGRYGIEVPVFTTELDADGATADTLSKEHDRMKSELKAKTEELNVLRAKIEKSYSQAKKAVKMAEPQTNWWAYGIEDKR